MQMQDFIRYYAATVLPNMESIALFKKEDKSEARGKYLFSEEPSIHSQKLKQNNNHRLVTVKKIFINLPNV